MMTDEQRQFAEDNINLVYKYFALKNVSDEDERAYLMEKYCDCILSYNKSIGAFSTYLYFTLDKYRIYLYNYNHRKCRWSPEPTVSLEDKELDDDDRIYMYINSEYFTDNLELLDVCEKVKIRLRIHKGNCNRKIDSVTMFELLMNGYTRKEIAAMYGVSHQAISKQIEKIKVVWKKELEGC